MKEILKEIAAQRSNSNAFGEWRAYREQLAKILIRGMPEGSSLAIYGAGPCNDIDLACLAEHFSQITLLDMDEASMDKALVRYGLIGSERIRTQTFDFVGISAKDYEKLGRSMDRVLDQTSAGEEQTAAVMMRPVIEAFYAELESGVFRAPRYDAVLAAGLHSQLNQTAVSMWRGLRQMRGLNTDPLHDPVCALMYEKTLPIIARFNQLLFYSARHKAFIAYELSIEGRQGGVQGAMQLKDDLERRQKQRQIHLEQRYEAVWPQNRAKGMIFTMAIDEYMIK